MSMSIDYETKRLTLEWVAGQFGLPATNAAAEDFSADPDFELSGTSTLTAAFAADGGVLLTTDATDGEHIYLTPHADTEHAIWDDITWGTDDEAEWECTFKVGDIDSCIAWLGLKLTTTDVVATDTDQAFFRYEDDISSAALVAQCSINDTDLSHVSDNIITAGEIVTVAAKFDKDEVCHMFINGREVFSRSFKGHTVDLKPFVGIEADGAADAAELTIYNQKISRILK